MIMFASLVCISLIFLHCENTKVDEKEMINPGKYTNNIITNALLLLVLKNYLYIIPLNSKSSDRIILHWSVFLSLL